MNQIDILDNSIQTNFNIPTQTSELYLSLTSLHLINTLFKELRLTIDKLVTYHFDNLSLQQNYTFDDIFNIINKIRLVIDSEYYIINYNSDIKQYLLPCLESNGTTDIILNELLQDTSKIINRFNYF